MRQATQEKDEFAATRSEDFEAFEGEPTREVPNEIVCFLAGDTVQSEPGASAFYPWETARAVRFK